MSHSEIQFAFPLFRHALQRLPIMCACAANWRYLQICLAFFLLAQGHCGEDRSEIIIDDRAVASFDCWEAAFGRKDTRTQRQLQHASTCKHCCSCIKTAFLPKDLCYHLKYPLADYQQPDCWVYSRHLQLFQNQFSSITFSLIKPYSVFIKTLLMKRTNDLQDNICSITLFIIRHPKCWSHSVYSEQLTPGTMC